MYEITNLSNNPLRLSDGKSIAPHETRKMKTVEKKDENYQSRGWLSIIDDTSEPEQKIDKSAAGGKK